MLTGETWLNVDRPLCLADLGGKVVLPASAQPGSAGHPMRTQGRIVEADTARASHKPSGEDMSAIRLPVLAHRPLA